MLHRYTRRRAMLTAMAATALTTLPSAAARQATPEAAHDGTITRSQIEAALARLDGLVADAMTQTGVPGAAVAVVHGDEVVYEKGFGVRELGKPEPITPETVFQLASVSKSISSTLVAAIIGDGATTWDATVADLLPGFGLADPWMTEQVTIRDVFSHRSGLPGYAGDSLVGTFGYGREEMVRRLRYVPPATSPRSAYAYTNVPLSAGGYAVAQAAGQPWEELAEERLFALLGMSSTSYRHANYADAANRAMPHYRMRSGDWALGEVTEADPTAPAGGVSSSVHDLTHWMRLQLGNGMFEGERVVAEAPLLETRRPQILETSPPNPASGPALFYGLGWHVQYDERGRLVIHHIGDFSAGFRAGVTLLPVARLGIVVLTNGWPNSLSDAIPKAFIETIDLGEPTQDWVGIIQAGTDEGLAAVAAVTPFPTGAAPVETAPLPLDAYTGSYTNAIYGDISVVAENDRLVAKIGPRPTSIELTHWDRDTFTYPLPPSGEVILGQLGVIFSIGPAGRASGISFGLSNIGPDSTAMFTRV
jgi:CubicO group peptidase (beta-lactamase class C family)